MRRPRSVIACLLLLVASATSSAEPRNDIYLEAFGKGGLWGLGYDRHLATRVSAGIVGSGFVLEGQRAISFSPYLGFYIVHRGRSAWFADVGAQVAHTWAVSPVPEWSGTAATGIGGFVSTGYEFRGRVLFRAFVHGVAGKGGVLPWLGASIGLPF